MSTRPSPLQNRVSPLGTLHAVAARGGWTGNRGVIHDDYRIVRRSGTDGWVTCLIDFRGRRRNVMAPRTWTELFFLDEATAFAVGHRPCFYCRREDAKRFASAWGAARFERSAKAPEMDAVMKRERAHVGRMREPDYAARFAALPEAPGDLPTGAMIEASGEAFLRAGGRFWRWSFEGYAPAQPTGTRRLLTPPSVVAAFRAGYRPQIHPSASA